MASLGRDIAGELLLMPAGPRLTGVAAGTGDNTNTKGTAIDTTTLASPAASAGFSPGVRYESVVFALAATSTLAAAATFTMTASIETAAASNFASPVVLKALTTVLTLTGPGGGGTLNGIGKIGCSLENALQYIRISYTGDLSAGSVDTSDIASIAIFGGAGELP